MALDGPRAAVTVSALDGHEAEALEQRRPSTRFSVQDDQDAPMNPNQRPEIFRSTVHEVLFVFTATMSVAMPSFLQGSTLVISSFIKRDLDMTTAQLTWMTAASSSVFLRNPARIEAFWSN